MTTTIREATYETTVERYVPEPGTNVEEVYRVLRQADGEEMTAPEIRQRVSYGETVNDANVGATLSTLRKDRERTGVIRTRFGYYAYRPDRLDEDYGDGPPKTLRPVGEITKEVLRGLHKLGRGTAAAVAEETGLTTKQVSNVLTRLLLRGGVPVRRLANGLYEYDETAGVVVGHHSDEPSKTKKVVVSENGKGPDRTTEVEGFVDRIPDQVYSSVGLRLIGQNQNGDRICQDENGVLWIIEVSARSRLL